MSRIKLFESKQIRTVWNETDGKWYFVVADVIQVLTDTPNPGDYIKKMRKRDEELSKGWGQFVTPLSVETEGGKHYIQFRKSSFAKPSCFKAIFIINSGTGSTCV